MLDIRWLEIPAGDREICSHPAAVFVDRGPYTVFRVLQVRSSTEEAWRDVPVVAYETPTGG